MTNMKTFQRTIRAWAIDKGWRGPDATPRSVAEDMALITSEVSEALEAAREHADPTVTWFTYTVTVTNLDGEEVKFKDVGRKQLCVLLECRDEDLDEAIYELGLKPKPEGVGPELADTIIRILDFAEEYGMDMEREVVRKMDHNQTRPWQHGGKLL